MNPWFPGRPTMNSAAVRKMVPERTVPAAVNPAAASVLLFSFFTSRNTACRRRINCCRNGSFRNHFPYGCAVHRRPAWKPGVHYPVFCCRFTCCLDQHDRHGGKEPFLQQLIRRRQAFCCSAFSQAEIRRRTSRLLAVCR